MAGDWIKMRSDLQTHPKVVRILSAMQCDRLRVVGALHAVWSIFDAHTADGMLHGYTLEALDAMVGWPGFAAEMEAVGWLVCTDDGLLAPDFAEHNGASAKRRGQETKRKQGSRKGAPTPRTVPPLSASDADTVRTREEKRREDALSPESAAGAPADGQASATTQAGEACKAMRQAGMASVNPSDPRLLQALASGITVAELSACAADAVQDGKPFGWAIAAAVGRRRDASRVVPIASGSAFRLNRQESLEESNMAAARAFVAEMSHA
ncbi:hypothetical protein [Xylophilus sp. Leaf220]|uniref:hypothetical protein n=1 Tax=Xylophilus sp. Leaf220 TaxID=1735686 RepID=UPI0006F40937|nr:hypothetical protein [Xylophilus sp. Leaf220]KQM72960.1 hypothetical protein ASE76_19470 [Xylophilus sp. Leaf220]